ncbi:molybdopterin biosynthesis protein [Thermosulfurimonas dismutans]|uniref:Molybdopterin molybdenumtransferase n=1 Tax=Thermosulfurimonas dismutans TaxID=999894 RepID=A0A179D202_9BACT|nr:molybdopterin biosynthesis protein [Thermosulfurimonas dismutans]OAQ20086.1 Molybdopterin biosynthesis protein MoeA [Thermosulfurimonas dismutans]
MKRKIYLHMKPLYEAQKIFLNAWDWKKALAQEDIPVKEARGRITAQPIFAKRSLPGFNSAAMDGIAVRAEDTFGASEANPLLLQIGKQAFLVNTGEPLPEGTNAVIMIEHVHFIKEDLVEIRSPVYPWQHVRRIGEDVVQGEMLFTEGHRLSAWDLGVLLASGYLTVTVRAKPRVIFIPTGDELVLPEEAEGEIPFGKTVEFNSTMLAALVEEWGGEAEIFPIVRDNYVELKKAVEKAASRKPHLIALIAGSSAGSKDYTAALIEEEGKLLVHGIQMMPGKPVVLGLVQNTPIIGVPGYPVSAVLAFEQMVRPVFEAMYGARIPRRPKVKAVSGCKIPSKLGVTEFLRVKAGKVGTQTVFLPLKRGAGAITTLTRADAIVRISSESEGLLQGAECEIELLRPEKDLAKTILVVGSHDLALDILAQFLRQKELGLELSTAHVGSLSGLMAIKDGLAHMAGTHLFDPETGEFNVPYIKRYLPETPVRLINFVYREQGLILPPGNPKGIRDLRDLAQKEVTFINRQPGSGTRVLLDYHLQKIGVSPREIQGYEVEETTHLGVAINVATGQADVGLGIRAAAKLLNLEFIPLFKERYDLLIRLDFYESPFFKVLQEVLTDPAFKKAVENLGGYDTSEMGKIIL